MKKFMLLVLILVLLTSMSLAQKIIRGSAYLMGSGTNIVKEVIIDNKKVISTNYYSGALYAIGYDFISGSSDTTQNTYRTYFEFDLSSIPTTATIDTVEVDYINGISGYTLKLTQVATINPNDDAANWAAIGNGSTLHSGLPYNGSSFISNSIKTVIQNSLPNRKIIIGALSEAETTDGSFTSMTLNLDVKYRYPAALLTLQARNDLYGSNGGNIGVGIYPNAAVSYPSPYTIPNVYETDRLNLAAYDNQMVNGKIWFFNDTEYPCEKSHWYKDKFGTLNDLGQLYSFTTSPLTMDDNGASFVAYLKTTSYTTNGIISSNEKWFSDVTLTGNVYVPSGVTLTITSCATVNFNGYGILLYGGTVNFQGGDPNCVYLKQSGSLKGYFG
ncbi:hypothetical protein ABRY23_14380, partial [Melioribacteraceae bacterium 4301-Me]|uniref:hypothetical protein n=1 Tax=Pyranulibacter aquaticus TaxID=3163344 RepID=UPI0035949A70